MADKAENAPEGGSVVISGQTVPESLGGDKQERTFTQAELERQIGERLARERAKYADYSQLKEKADKFEELQAETQTELEKAVAKARKEERAKAVEEYETERRANRLQVAVSNHARELADVDDVVMNLRGTDATIFTDEGQVDDEALGKALTDLLERKPHLRVGGQVPTGDADAGRGASAATLPPEQQHNVDLLSQLGLKRT
jgi:nucleotide-binding universal stress UspA family protein